MKQWKILGLLTMLLGLSIAVQAQDIVKLKDGSFIRGTIIEYIANDHVRIKTEEGKIYEYPASEVLVTDMGVASGIRIRKVPEVKTNGFYNLTTLGIGLGTNYGSLRGGPGLYMVNGWLWKGRLMTGIGTGVEYMNKAVRMPITADVRWKFLKGNFSPFAGLFAGYTVSGKTQGYYYDGWGYNSQSKEFGGITTGAQIGFISQLGPHVGLTANAGYRYQKFTREYDQGFWNGTETVPMVVKEVSYLNRMTLGFGLLFN